MLDVEYARFKDDTIRRIREDEEQYAQLQEDIRALEAEIEAEKQEREARVLSDAPTPTTSQRPVAVTEAPKIEKASRNTPHPSEPTPAISSNAGTLIPQARPLQAPFDRTLPPPSPQRNDYGVVLDQQGFLSGPSAQHTRTLPPLPGLSPMHPPIDLHPPHRRTPSGSAPGRGSPLPYPPQQPAQYQQYPPYNQPQHPWPPQQPYPQSHSPHAGAHFYQNGPPQQGIPPAATPIAPQFPYYPQSAPVNHYNRGPQQPWPVSMPYPPYVQPASAGITPVQQKNGAVSRSQAPGSSTPWKRKRSTMAGLRVPSPEPPRDVSPFSDVETPGPVSKSKSNVPKPKGKTKKQEKAPQKAAESRETGRNRAGSTASSTVDRSSRSQSMASIASVPRPASGHKGRSTKKIKPEPTSTPAAFLPSDSDMQRSSGTRRSRGETLTAYDAPTRAGLKRKRESIQGSSPLASSPPYQRTRRERAFQDTNTISVSKTFGRIALKLMEQVLGHRHAEIFKKPLRERDAPGYKSLILKPQDLNGIKSAVTKGSKAASAAIEELDQKISDAPTTVERTEDLVPPKGIVNMDQLEMELMRVFANAVMFNPLPDAERGLGPRRSSRLSATPNQGGERGYAGSETGGIAQIAREMCEDVVAMIETFKTPEQSRMEVD